MVEVLFQTFSTDIYYIGYMKNNNLKFPLRIGRKFGITFQKYYLICLYEIVTFVRYIPVWFVYAVMEQFQQRIG